MVINPYYKFVYISCPKCGTHAMYSALAKMFGCSHKPNSDDWHPVEVPDFAATEDWCHFTIVRNPYRRAVSMWWHLLYRAPYVKEWRKKMVFGDHIHNDFRASFSMFMEYVCRGNSRENVVLYPMWEWHERITPNEAYHHMQFIHLENISREIRTLPFVPSDLSITIPVVFDCTVRAILPGYGDWRDVITDESKTMVEKWAGPDFHLFGYDQEIDHDEPRQE